MQLMSTLSAKEEGYPFVDRCLRHAVRRLLEVNAEAKGSAFLESVSTFQRPYTEGQINGLYRSLTRHSGFKASLTSLAITLPTQAEIDAYVREIAQNTPAKPTAKTPVAPPKKDDAEFRKQQYFRLLATIGNLQGDIAPGLSLYKHQREAVRVGLYKPSLIIGDEPGLGKSYAGLTIALARQRLYKEKIFVVTTPSMMQDWERSAEKIGAIIEVISWGKVGGWGIGVVHQPYTFIIDEAHYAANEKTMRSKAVRRIADDSKCKFVIALTATPMSNSEPSNLYHLLLLCHHPLVWDTDKKAIAHKKNVYMSMFHVRERQYIGNGKYAMHNVSVKNHELLHQLAFYHPEKKNENHPDACIIARRQDDCLDLPQKRRIMQQVTMNATQIEAFIDEAEHMWVQYEKNVREKIQQYDAETVWDITDDIENEDGDTVHKQKLREKEKQIRRAQAMVAYGIYRHAGALAKIESAVELAEQIVATGKKLVIFTSFIDVAKKIAQELHKNTGKTVGLLLGETKKSDRYTVVDDFQKEDGDTQVMVCSAAGGEGITLTRASYMIIVDRLWNPKSVTQWEGRIRRVDDLTRLHSHETIYWLQIPEDVVDTDIKIDALIQEKQKNVDAIQFNEQTDGMEFINGDEDLERILRDTYKQIQHK